MACLIERTSDGKTVSRAVLHEALVELFEAILGPMEGEWATVNQLSEEEEPSDAERAALFSEAAGASDPIVTLSRDRFEPTAFRL